MPTQTTDTDVQARWFLSNLAVIHLRGEQTEGRADLVELTMPPGDEPPLHVHHEHEESWYVTEGELTVFIAGREPRTVRAGEFALAPRGVAHILRAGDEGATALVQSSPAGFARFVEQASAPAAAAVLPPPPEGPPSPEQVEQLTRLAAEHGIEILGPPGMRP